jgi:excinuclease ABC subunit A
MVEEVKPKERKKLEDIFIKGARSNNLKNVDLKIPRNKLIVVTGVSGSGKSSITMDTLYAEGQRRYVESLSSYARQFLMRMKKPEVDYIKGICPAIAIEQKTTSGSNRSTVGSMTEIFEFLRLLYARVGKTISPITNQIVIKHQVTDVVNFIQANTEGTRVQILAPLKIGKNSTFAMKMDYLQQKGYTRIWAANEIFEIINIIEEQKEIENPFILIDRVAVTLDDKDNIQRIADSVQTAMIESEGECTVWIDNKGTTTFNNRFELDGIIFPEPTPQLFNYNNPYGACPQCEGFGKVMGIDEDKVVPDKSKSVYEGAIACWKGERGGEWLSAFLNAATRLDFPIHRGYEDLSAEEKSLLWKGNATIHGIDAYFNMLEEQTYKIQNRVMLARFRGKTNCPTCEGSRLRKEAKYVKINGTPISDLVDIPIEELFVFFQNMKLEDNDSKVANRLLLEINNRLHFMMDVGLGYLTLSRVSNTLSGGETQRINLTRTLGSNLTSSMYILDEPSVGLHPRDTKKLVTVLKKLRDLGNTVIVVEHEEDVIQSADYLIDIGPNAGINGGEVVFEGNYRDVNIENNFKSLTVDYLTGRKNIDYPTQRRRPANFIKVLKANKNNIKNLDVDFPLNCITVMTGVSGSGKTTLVRDILHPALVLMVENPNNVSDTLKGDLKMISQVEMINQNPIGKSSRSNPVTYVKAYDDIRDLYSKQQLAKVRGYKASHFSFNIDGGRCDTCKGEGEQVVEMQFLADVRLECEECGGKRFKKEILDVKYLDKDIADILNLSVLEALDFFKGEKAILQKIQPLATVGLDYIKLGQSSSTLSGGEAQRVKLATFLSKEKVTENIFFIFDEPTTGLHFHDIKKLLVAFNALVEKGHTVLIVEHNMEVIKNADWILDLGPESGKYGGKLVYAGNPEGLVGIKESHTATFLKEKLLKN